MASCILIAMCSFKLFFTVEAVAHTDSLLRFLSATSHRLCFLSDSLIAVLRERFVDGIGMPTLATDWIIASDNGAHVSTVRLHGSRVLGIPRHSSLRAVDRGACMS